MRPIVLLGLASLSCGPAASPSEMTQLTTLARSGDYKSWASEAAAHASMGPHGTVRTFVNEKLLGSLRSGADTHPPGSIAVKELYEGTSVTGYAIDSKGADGGWHFFEGFEPALNQYYYEGTQNGCAGCHRPGKDFILTPVSALRDAGVP